MRYPLTFVFFMSCLNAVAAVAADNCTAWSRQSDGSEWRLCTKESNGQRYCQERRGKTITNVSCAK